MLPTLTENLLNLEKILEQYVPKNKIEARKQYMYKTHEECYNEEWKRVFLIDYEIELNRWIRTERFINMY